MRFLLVVLALIGFVDSGFALREHYRTDVSPCSINEHWDCGIVNHSPFAVMAGVPVAIIGMSGYLFLGLLAFKRAYRIFLASALLGLAFSLYLAHVEAHILGVWCVYCAASLAIISLMTLVAAAAVLFSRSAGAANQKSALS
jgi:vitamin-K-epoxide reductase (warfarin-sensitive)